MDTVQPLPFDKSKTISWEVPTACVLKIIFEIDTVGDKAVYFSLWFNERGSADSFLLLAITISKLQ